MEVFCPNYGRTGTKSMQVALEILGFGPCYHMFSVFFKHIRAHPQLWLDGYQGRGLDVTKLLEGYKSVTDWPAADFHQDIIKEYPDAKVILTLRDPDSWWESVKNTTHNRGAGVGSWGWFFLKVLVPRFRKFSYMTRHIVTLNVVEEEAKADYVRHVAEVKAHVSPDKLLKFSVKDGWEPLCSFLEVAIPDVPFPKLNARQEMEEIIARAGRQGWLLMAAAIAAAGVSVGVVACLGGMRAGMVIATLEASFLSWSVIDAARVSRFFRENPQAADGAAAKETR